MSEAVLRLSGVTREHRQGDVVVQALRGVDLAVHPGELVAVMGPSGSGKSTLLHLAGGLDSPTTGAVVVEGRDLATLAPAQVAAVRRRSVGYVFQDLNLLPSLSAVENVALPLELDGVRGGMARRAAREALDEVGAGALAGRFPDEMSGGQQQRVAIARALVGPRRLLLADEPTGALDSTTGEEVLRVLRGRCEAGAAGVLVTHEARHAPGPTGWSSCGTASSSTRAGRPRRRSRCCPPAASGERQADALAPRAAHRPP
ncbi:ABC transporter ATP-binding protein [Blastococcus sp. SYSU DS1024]